MRKAMRASALAAALAAFVLPGTATSRAGEEAQPARAPAPAVDPDELVRRLSRELKEFSARNTVGNAATYYIAAMLAAEKVEPEPAAEVDAFVTGTLQSAPPQILTEYPEAAAHVRLYGGGVVYCLHRAAGMKRCCFDLEYAKGPGMELRHLALMRDLARRAGAYGKWLECQRRPAEAAVVYLDIMRMGCHLDQEPVMINKLVGMALVQIGGFHIRGMLARQPDEGAARTALDGLLALSADPFDMAAAMEGERVSFGGAYVLDLLKAADEGREKTIEMLEQVIGRDFKWHEKLLVPTETARLKGMIAAGFRVYEEEMKLVEQAMRGPYHEARPKLEKLTDQKTVVERAKAKGVALAGHIIASLMPSYLRVKVQEARTQALLGGVRLLAAAAVEKARAGGPGKYPGKIDELRKHFPKENAFPKDPFTGGDFKYSLDAAGRPVVETPGDDPGIRQPMRGRLYVFSLSKALEREKQALERWRAEHGRQRPPDPPAEEEVF